MEIRDVGQAKPAYFPRLKGPALVYCGIITGGISVIMLGLTPVLLFIIYVRANACLGLPIARMPRVVV